MNAAKVATDCARFANSMEPYIDGELDPDHVMDIEGHVLECAVCSEQVALARATRQSLKRCAVGTASAALRARVCAGIAQERERAAAQERTAAVADASADHAPTLIRLRYAVALAAAAGIVFAMGVTRLRSGGSGGNIAPIAATPSVGAPTSNATATAGFDTMLEDLVALHAHPLPPETTNPEELQRFDPLVGVPVRRPSFQPFGGRFNGARVHAMRDRRAALLQYTVDGGHRVTVYVFDPRTTPVHASGLRARVVRERPVFVGKLRGYSVAAAEQSGVGYALASDLDDDESTQLVLAAAR